MRKITRSQLHVDENVLVPPRGALLPHSPDSRYIPHRHEPYTHTQTTAKGGQMWESENGSESHTVTSLVRALLLVVVNAFPLTTTETPIPQFWWSAAHIICPYNQGNFNFCFVFHHRRNKKTIYCCNLHMISCRMRACMHTYVRMYILSVCHVLSLHEQSVPR